MLTSSDMGTGQLASRSSRFQPPRGTFRFNRGIAPNYPVLEGPTTHDTGDAVAAFPAGNHAE